MRNTRPANSASLALSRLALLKSLLKLPRQPPSLPSTRARRARRAPNSAGAVEMASEIGGVTHTVWRRRGGEGCGAHRRDRTDPHQPPVRRGERAACAGCRRFPVGHWVSG